MISNSAHHKNASICRTGTRFDWVKIRHKSYSIVIV